MAGRNAVKGRGGAALLLALSAFACALVLAMPGEALAATSGDWRWPTYNESLKNDWPNYASGSFHGGTDFPVPTGTPVYATCDCVVEQARSMTTSYGNHVKVGATVEDETVHIRYCHLTSYVVGAGDELEAGDLIGYSGSTGNSTGPHLHYEVRDSSDSYSGGSLNPRLYLPGTSYRYELNKQDLPFRCSIDAPTDWLSFNGNLYVQGWAIWNTPPSRILYSINGGPETMLSFYYREDVHNAYPAYPTDNNGWRGTITNASFNSGVNTITFTVDFGGERKDIGSCSINNVYNGKAPEMSDIRITNVTTDGYTVTCNVSASNGLKSVKFPTWTVLNGQDDITWESKKVSGNVATVGYNVKVESHGYYHGLYCTHIYARDELGYESGIGANNIIVPTAMATTTDSTYLLVDTDALRSDWLGARDVVSSSWQANYLGGHLVSITSQEEQDVVADLAHSRNGYRFGYWMGLNNLDGDAFSWTSGEEVSYTNWAADQPSVADNKHYGAMMWESGEWENLTRTATSSGYVVDGRTNLGFILEVPNSATDPVLSDPAVIYDADGEGFTARVKVGANSNVAYVKFPTWTAADASDVKWNDGTIKNGYATYHVNKSDFGHKGPYFVHVYAYDAADNDIGFASVSTGGRTIMLPAAKAYHDGHVYYVVDKMATFDTAEGWASKYRGEPDADGMRCHLASIDSAEEQQVVADLVSKSAYQYHWIGLTDRDDEGRFGWVTGEEVGYANWLSGEPNGAGAENHVVICSTDGTWRDAPNEASWEDQPIGYVVEFDTPYADVHTGSEAALSEPTVTYDEDGCGFNVSVKTGGDLDVARVQFPVWTALDRSDTHWYEATLEGDVASCHVEKADFGHKGPYYVNAYARDKSGGVLQVLDVNKGATIMLPTAKSTLNGHVYYAVDKASTFETAEAWASAYKGDADTTGCKSHLVTIEGEEEQQAVAELIGRSDYDLHWLGLTDEGREGDFRWITGEEMSYSNWAAGEPNGGASENYAALRSSDAAWIDSANVSGLSDGLPRGYVVEFEPLVVKKPLAEVTLPYNGEEQSAISPGVGYALSGSLYETEVGNYTTTVELVDGYTWEDGTVDAATCAWSIVKAKGNAVSVEDLTYTYDGIGHSIQTPVASMENSSILYSLDGSNWIDRNPVFCGTGKWFLYVKATNDCYEDTETVKATIVCEPATLTAIYKGEAIVQGDTPKAEVDVSGFVEGDEGGGDFAYKAPTITLPDHLGPGTYDLTPQGGEADNYVFRYVGGTLTVVQREYKKDGWVDLPGESKGYVRNGKLVVGWMDLDGAKYWFHADGAMATGWIDVDVNGKAMHYYFNPASGNLVRGTWFDIGGAKYYFRPSGNLATGWATISDGSVDKKYYFDPEGRLLTGWCDIDNGQGQVNHYYFRPSGSMATGWATIDGQKYWFRPSGNMATGWADVDDAYKRYFDAQGHMLVGWRQIDGKTFYFRASGAMQTGRATIDGREYEFTASGTLKSGTVPAQADGSETLGTQSGEGDPIEIDEGDATAHVDDEGDPPVVAGESKRADTSIAVIQDESVV